MDNSENSLFFDSPLLSSPSIELGSEIISEIVYDQTPYNVLYPVDAFDLGESSCELLQLPNHSEALRGETKLEAQENSKGKKRGRRKIYETEEQRKAKKAENNRRTAKANRERKQIYIERLERQVGLLSNELQMYRARLSKYEIVDQHRSLFGYELYRAFARVTQGLSVDGKFLSDPGTYAARVKVEMHSFIQERCKALEELARSMVEISIPMPWRFIFWSLDNNVDVINLQKEIPALRMPIGEGSVKTLAEIFKENFRDKFESCNVKAYFIASVKKIKSLVKMIVKLQREVQIEMIKIAKHIMNAFSPFITPHSGRLLSQFIALVRNLPEVSDGMVYQLKDSDFNATTDYETIHFSKEDTSEERERK